MENSGRTEALQNLVASVAVIIWSQDLEMSVAIVDETAQRYGEDFTNDLLLELMPVLSGDVSGAARDVFLTAAMGWALRPLPHNWSQTKN